MSNAHTDRLAAALADRYRIERELGAGGMATVYLAADIKHDRKVAIKVLRPELAAVLGAERFVQEIKTTAALSHPHILPLFDSGEADGFLYYVMPYIQGETVREKLNRETQLGIDEAVRITTEVADALDYAHRNGVIHRDIKPENILLHDGRPMVMDFGIALAVSAAAGGRMTETGLSLGTPHYMSPEQATAEKDITGRSDIYSLGAVLYEMLTGNPPHVGASAQQIIMKIVTEEAAPVTSLRKSVPPNVAAAISRAIDKLPADRFEGAKAFAAALADPLFATATPVAPEAARTDVRRWRRTAGGLGFALAVMAVVAVIGWMRDRPPGLVRRFQVTMDRFEAENSGNPVISPDGTRILYSDPEGALLMLSNDELAARLLPGSELAWTPVFSPDSRTIAFNTGFPGALKVLPLDGGAVRTLVPDSTYISGLSWSDDDWIYFLHGAEYGRDLMRIRPSGEAAEFITRPDSAANALFFRWPQALPGGRKVLLTVVQRTGDRSVGVVDVTSGQVTTIAAGVLARYARSGHLMVAQEDGTLIAARFDGATGTVRGPFRPIVSGLYLFPTINTPMSLSDEGTFVYVAASPGGQVVRVSRADRREEVVDPEWQGEFGHLAVSPDGSRLAISVSRGGRYELWVRALGSGALTRLSSSGTQSYRPSWSPDGRAVVFTSDQGGKVTTWIVPADGSSPPTPFLPGVARSVDEAEYSRDGQWIVYRGGSGAGRDIFAMRAGRDSSARAVVATGAEEFSPTLSPDGRWLAYASDETGRTEVYVRPFPNAGLARYTVSRNGGSEPRWAHSGRELFFRDGDQNLVAVDVTAGDVFGVGAERTLFSTRGYYTDNRHHGYAVAPDDRSFYFSKSASVSRGVDQVIFTLNWFEELKRKVGQ